MRIAGVVLGAGLGSRMRPLTNTLPKPLLPLLGEPLIIHLVRRLAAAGAASVFVNLHFGSDLVRSALEAADSPVPVRTRVEAELTGPAGALRCFAQELRGYDAVLVTSGDVVCGDDLGDLVTFHAAYGADLTFGVTRVQRAHRYGVLDLADDGAVLGAREKPAVPPEEWHWISAGVYCLDPATIARFPDGGVYDYAAHLAPDLNARGGRVAAARLPGYWRDIGDPASFRDANLDAARGEIGWLAPSRGPVGQEVTVRGPVHIGEGVQCAPGVSIVGPSVIDAGAVVGANAWIEGSVVLPGTVVAPGTLAIGAVLANTAGPARPPRGPQPAAAGRRG